MMVKKRLPTKQSSITAVKRKLGDQDKIHESKLYGFTAEKAKKAPLKAEIILKSKELEKEHEALKLEYEALKLETEQYVDNKQDLERKVLD